MYIFEHFSFVFTLLHTMRNRVCAKKCLRNNLFTSYFWRRQHYITDQLIPSESYSILTVGLTTKVSRYTVSLLLELDFRPLLYIY